MARPACPETRVAPVLKVGEWLSLVEHLVRDQGVGGSNPLSPTNLFNKIQPFRNPEKSHCRQFCNSDFLTVARSFALAIVNCMERSESPQASSDDDEAFIAEFKQRPSTFPNIGIDLRGYESEDFARSVGNEVLAFLTLFGKILNLERLHRVVVAYDYAETIASIDRGVETGRTLTPTKDDFAEGVAMTPAILVDGEPRSVMVLSALHMAVLAYPDEPQCAEHRELMIHTLAHESGHVHEHQIDLRAAVNALLRMLSINSACLPNAPARRVAGVPSLSARRGRTIPPWRACRHRRRRAAPSARRSLC